MTAAIGKSGDECRGGSLKPAREARLADLPRMEEAAREFYAASRFLRVFDPARFVGLWAQMISVGIGVIYVLGEERIEGALGGMVYPEPYSGDLVATEFFWFVRPGHRGGGMALYRAFESWARERGCSQLRMVHLADSMPEKLDRVYRRMGYEPAEVLYVKELEP